MLLGVQQLPRLKQFAGEARSRRKGAPLPGRAVKNQYRVPHRPGFITLGGAQSTIMQAQFGQGFTTIESEIANKAVGFARVHALWSLALFVCQPEIIGRL